MRCPRWAECQVDRRPIHWPDEEWIITTTTVARIPSALEATGDTLEPATGPGQQRGRGPVLFTQYYERTSQSQDVFYPVRLVPQIRCRPGKVGSLQPIQRRHDVSLTGVDTVVGQG